MNSLYQSVFDIIGPVMVGPSSSHTAGAAKIGKIMRIIFGGTPDSADIHLYGSFAKTYRGHGTDYALVGGLLGMAPDDRRLPNSLTIAKEQGLKIKLMPEKEPATHPNTAKMILKDDHHEMSITGVSVGGGAAKIVDINGFPISFLFKQPTILIFHQDIPGAIASVSQVISENGINISTMNVNRENKGKNAIMVIEVDNCSDPTIIDKLRAIPAVHDARFIA